MDTYFYKESAVCLEKHPAPLIATKPVLDKQLMTYFRPLPPV